MLWGLPCCPEDSEAEDPSAAFRGRKHPLCKAPKLFGGLAFLCLAGLNGSLWLSARVVVDETF